MLFENHCLCFLHAGYYSTNKYNTVLCRSFYAMLYSMSAFQYDLKLAKSFLGPSKSDSPEYKMYIEMEERSESKASVRTSTSVRSDSVLSTEKYAETSDAESELQMVMFSIALA